LGQPPYQRVTTATDYDTAGFLPYLACDGIDDGMATANIDFTGTDKVTVVAGLRKLSDAAGATLVELGYSVATESGIFILDAPPAGNQYGFYSKGTTTAGALVSSGHAAPRSGVLTGIGSIAANIAQLRVNGAVSATSTDSQGGGNYRNASLVLFRRAGTSRPFNGRFHGLVVVGSLLPDSQLRQLEMWMNRKTGAF
jgi:hypothetical protein